MQIHGFLLILVRKWGEGVPVLNQYQERKQIDMTEIAKLGEFGLIKHLTKELPQGQSTTIKGVGDDCAVLKSVDGKNLLLTSDMLMEGIHFDLQYTPLQHLGYKAAMANLSDVYAMNGKPTQLLVNLAISGRFAVEDVEALYSGIRLACKKHDVDIVGGDISTSLTGLAISITCVGEATEGEVVYRSGAKSTDLLCVSGNLGAAYMGLQLMEREKHIFNSRPSTEAEAAQPDFSGREYLLERLLKPEARRDVVESLRAAGIRPTAMIDVSDGLSSEVMHICEASGVGARIYEERLPLDYQTAVAAEEFNMNVSTCALNGGDDYELLFTVPLTAHEAVSQIPDVRIIGHITSAEQGRMLVSRDGQEFELKAQGWNNQ